MNRGHEKSQRPWRGRALIRGVVTGHLNDVSLHLTLSTFPASLLPPSWPFSRSFSIFGRVRDISESLTAIKTLIKWDGAPRCNGGTYPAEREKGSVRSRRMSEPGRREERTSCGESILLRRRLRGPIFFQSSLPLSFSRPYFSSFSLSFSLSFALYKPLWVLCSSQCLSTCLSCNCVYITNRTFPHG